MAKASTSSTKSSIKKVHQYTAVFEPDPVEGGYTAYIPALPGCISEGDTFEEAQANIKEAAELYLDTLKLKSQKFPARTDLVISPISVPA